jgi:hypothetical protein
LPPLVLVTAIRHADLAGHAHDLGAAGVWSPPYRASQLRTVIHRSSA